MQLALGSIAQSVARLAADPGVTSCNYNENMPIQI